MANCAPAASADASRPTRQPAPWSAATARTGNSADTAADITASLDTDPVAARVWAEATDALGRALVTSTLLLDHQRIVLAGGMTAAGDRLAAPVRRSLQRGLAWRTAPAVEISPWARTLGSSERLCTPRQPWTRPPG
ncbi:ROK family protein [Streptomyces sp. HUCO-GS316]|uniref:ROK family protein n=1 Tax=Streptomyces sp. HUCO-GS316 TaxID=2692198 RepID=UPI003FA76397